MSDELATFALVLARVGPLVALGPWRVLGVPRVVLVALAVVLAVVLVPFAGSAAGAASLPALAAEALRGLGFGLGALVPWVVVEAFFGLSHGEDEAFSAPMRAFSGVFFGAIFLSVGGGTVLVEGLATSFVRAPVGGSLAAAEVTSSAWLASRAVTDALALGVRLAVPALAAKVATDALGGLLVRTTGSPTLAVPARAFGGVAVTVVVALLLGHAFEAVLRASRTGADVASAWLSGG